MSVKVFGIVSHVMVMAIVISVILLFLGIGALVLIHVCIVGRAFGRGSSSDSLIERGTASAINNHSTSMSQDDLETLPVYEYNKAVEKGTSPVDCVVCLENFKTGDKCRLLPICKHSFHAECIDSWLLKTPICPICRTSAGSRKGITTVLGFEGLRSVAVRIELREEIIQSSLVESQVRTNLSSPLRNSPSEDAV